MTIEADNSLGCGQRANLTTTLSKDDLGIPTAKYPGSGSINLARVSSINIVDRVSINSTTNDIETDETNGNTLFQVRVDACLALGVASGASDEVEDFNGDFAPGYCLQAVTLDDQDCLIATSAVTAMAVGGYINAADVMKRVCLQKFIGSGATNAVDGTSTGALTGAVDESTS